ncbi:MAG: NAD(P)-dependent oxidoreductase [Actinotalea sp.]|nr:NAD(P)-dependent oxidoreductase [Actinotalea sp.]
MSLVVTGATGQLGRLVIDSLLAGGVPAESVVAAGRSSDRLAALAERGVRTAVIEYGDLDTLVETFTGAETVLLISGSEVGQRVEQHRNAIAAAEKAGVRRLVYTSAPHADTADLILAPEHRATEELLQESGLAVTILRNNWYTENYAGLLDQARATGEIVASAGDGRVASAPREDYAQAAAVVLTTDGHEGAVYELSGDVAWTFDELAAAVGEVIGSPVTYRAVAPAEHHAALVDAGLDTGTAGFLVALDGNIRDGALSDATGELSRLIGRPTTSLVDALRATQA